MKSDIQVEKCEKMDAYKGAVISIVSILRTLNNLGEILGVLASVTSTVVANCDLDEETANRFYEDLVSMCKEHGEEVEEVEVISANEDVGEVM